jgi:hypothetical protein
MGVGLTFADVNDFVHSENVQFEELQALCLGLANELDKASQKPDCNSCANRGLVNGLSQETFCEQCVWSGQTWKINHFKVGA